MNSSGDPPDPALRSQSSLGTQIGVLAAIHSIALLTSGLRMYTRAFLVKAYGADDGTAAAATIIAFVSFVLYIYESQHGLGRHAAFVSIPDLLDFGAANFAQTNINLVGLGLLKISVALALLRLSKSKTYTRILYAAIAFVSIYTIFAVLTLILYCKPVNGFWDFTIHAKCYSISLFIRFGLANTALSIFTDILLATLPIPIIWKLQLKTKTRVYLILVLALGFAAVGIGIVKAVNQINFNANEDETFQIAVVFWAFVQLNVSIIAACIPSLKPLLRPLPGMMDYYPNPTQSRENTFRSAGGRYSKYVREGMELDEWPIVVPDAYHAWAHSDLGDGSSKATHMRGDNPQPASCSSDETLFAPMQSPSVDPNRAGGIVRTTEVTVSRS
ncbi:hypothetical protein F5Y16DRAFT_423674 [Xylariaceae sp. FL0255]|nr:hypothetical protein F5Y16DRAFT_423674 [Xylariaceae sp. FL0255]